MPAALHNFFIEQGSDFEIVFEYFDENGSPIVIANSWCIRLKVKDNNNIYYVWRDGVAADGSQLVTQFQDSNLSSNQIKWYLPSKVTRRYNFDNASYVLDLVKDTAENNTIKLATGQIAIIKDLFLTECIENSALPTCVECRAIDANAAIGSRDPTITPTPTSLPSNFDPTVTPTPTPTPNGANNNNPVAQQENLCDYLCKGLDIFSELYQGSGQLNILDASTNNGLSSPSLSFSTITIVNTGIAVNIELFIDTLTHENPSDLTMFLTPPEGNKILLSHRQKIKNYSLGSGLSFAYSNKALPDTYLYNKTDGNDLYVNILQNSGVIQPAPYNHTYAYSFDHLLNSSVDGNWTLNILDNDPGGTGFIKNWNLIVTYKPTEYSEE